MFRSRRGVMSLAFQLGTSIVNGTPWEPAVKRALYAVTGKKNYAYDSMTVAIMKRVLKRDSNAVDVGAFEGGMLRHIVRLAPNGRHWAFEPLPGKADRLRRTFPNVQVQPCALADSAGTAEYNWVVQAPALSGLRKRSDLTDDELVSKVSVQVETLDRVIPGDVPIAFVKVDVEGGELGVFRGGRDTLRRTRPVIVFECGLGGSDAYETKPWDVFRTVTEEIGLRVSLLSSWLKGAPPLTREEFIDQYEKSLNFYFVAHP